MNNKIKNNKNLGLELLRMILSFWVIAFHCCKIKNKKIRNIIKLYLHVPTFLIISFYFLYSTISNKNIIIIKKRIYRLCIPYFIYPLLIWTINNVLYCFFKFNRFNRKLSIRDLLTQLLIGRPIHGVLWFHFHLLFITLLFTIISFIFKKQFILVIGVLGTISYIYQYSNFNYMFFCQYKFHIKYSLGYFFETIPISVTGIFISSIKFINKLEKNKYSNLIFCLMLFFLLFKFKLFKDVNGFNYQGIMKNIDSVLLFVFFSLLPFEKIKNKYLILFIKSITKYTGGIYYLHIIVYQYLQRLINIIKRGTIFGGIIIYISSYFISFLGIKIFLKTQFKHLFI